MLISMESNIAIGSRVLNAIPDTLPIVATVVGYHAITGDVILEHPSIGKWCCPTNNVKFISDGKCNENGVDVTAIIFAADCIARVAYDICGGKHGSPWVFDKLMRFFDCQTFIGIDNIKIPITLTTNGELVKLNAIVTRRGELDFQR